ncbi:MAG: SpoIIE family protein phosphatase [Phycisphaeraceae bacterium]|nr:SpoIIE family protein phosphatase [Phycisphaeraceae bacterium]
MPLHASANIPALALIAPTDGEARAADLLHTILAHWPPHCPRPTAQFVPLHPLTASNPPVEPESIWRAFSAAIIFPSPMTKPVLMDRLAAELHDVLTPALVLADHPSGATTRLRSANLSVLATDEDPAIIAATLAAVIGRQPSVRAMQVQCRLAQSLEGGISAEIERLNDELMLAAHVQREFLPKSLPVIEGLDAGVLFRPAGFVSGDIYDIARLDDRRIGFYVADAMGHGLPAALMTLFIAAHLSFHQADSSGHRIVSPADVLTRLNAALCAARAGPARFVSAVCGVMDTHDQTVTLASAGHPSPLRIGARGVERIDLSGMLLGIMDDSVYEQATIRLAPGESLVIHSDGVNSPSRDEPQAFLDAPDAELCAPFIARCRGSGPEALAESLDRVAHVLDRRSGSFHQGDDITLLALSLKQAEAAAGPAIAA